MTVNDDWLDPSEEEEVSPAPSAAVERLRRRRRRAQPLLPWWLVAAGGLVVVLAIVLLWVWAAKAMKESKEPPTIAITPTFTHVLPTATLVPTEALTPFPPTDTPVPPTPTALAEIAIGGWVKVVGTGDTGLSYRAGPGLENVRLKIVTDGAVLKVLDGPRESDGFTWWRLEEYVSGQPGVVGWAINEYLEPTSAP
jgi:hypothetical protein